MSKSTEIIDAVRRTGVHCSVSETRWIEATGSEAGRHLQAMLAQDLDACDRGGSSYSVFADDRARYLADMWVFRPAHEWRLEVVSNLAAAVVERLNMFAVSADAMLRDLKTEIDLYHLEGPGVEALVKNFFRSELDPELRSAGKLVWQELEIEYLWRSRFGERGLTLAVPKARADELVDALGTFATQAGFCPLPPRVQELLRIAAGRPLGGKDILPTDLVLEAGLVAGVSLSKGCYPGQEIMQRVARQGQLRRRLGGARVTEIEPSLEKGEVELFHPTGEFAGRICSAATHAARQETWGLAWFTGGCNEQGGKLWLQARDKRMEVIPVTLPFVSGSRSPLPEVPRYQEGIRSAR